MKKSRYTEEQIIGILGAGQGGREDGRPVPGAWDQRSHVLQLEGEVRRTGRERGAATAADGR